MPLPPWLFALGAVVLWMLCARGLALLAPDPFVAWLLGAPRRSTRPERCDGGPRSPYREAPPPEPEPPPGPFSRDAALLYYRQHEWLVQLHERMRAVEEKIALAPVEPPPPPDGLSAETKRALDAATHAVALEEGYATLGKMTLELARREREAAGKNGGSS